MLVAAYGSLKKGFYNHTALGDAEFLGTTKVRGVMYWNGSYPKLYKMGNARDHIVKIDGPFSYTKLSDHEVEIYCVDYDHAQYIKGMEEGAGYIEEELQTEWGMAKIYYMPHENFSERDKWITAYTAALFKQ